MTQKDVPRTQPVQAFSDEELVREISLHNVSALRELFKRYAPGLHAYVLREQTNHGDADFQLQEIFYLIWSRKLTYRKHRHGSVHTWIYGIAKGFIAQRDGGQSDTSFVPGRAFNIGDV